MTYDSSRPKQFVTDDTSRAQIVVTNGHDVTNPSTDINIWQDSGSSAILEEVWLRDSTPSYPSTAQITPAVYSSTMKPDRQGIALRLNTPSYIKADTSTFASIAVNTEQDPNAATPVRRFELEIVRQAPSVNVSLGSWGASIGTASAVDSIHPTVVDAGLNYGDRVDEEYFRNRHFALGTPHSSRLYSYLMGGPGSGADVDADLDLTLSPTGSSLDVDGAGNPRHRLSVGVYPCPRAVNASHTVCDFDPTDSKLAPNLPTTHTPGDLVNVKLLPCDETTWPRPCTTMVVVDIESEASRFNILEPPAGQTLVTWGTRDDRLKDRYVLFLSRPPKVPPSTDTTWHDDLIQHVRLELLNFDTTSEGKNAREEPNGGLGPPRVMTEMGRDYSDNSVTHTTTCPATAWYNASPPAFQELVLVSDDANSRLSVGAGDDLRLRIGPDPVAWFESYGEYRKDVNGNNSDIDFAHTFNAAYGATRYDDMPAYEYMIMMAELDSTGAVIDERVVGEGTLSGGNYAEVSAPITSSNQFVLWAKVYRTGNLANAHFARTSPAEGSLAANIDRSFLPSVTNNISYLGELAGINQGKPSLGASNCVKALVFNVGYGHMDLSTSVVTGLTNPYDMVVSETHATITITGKDIYSNDITDVARSYDSDEIVASVCAPRRGRVPISQDLNRDLLGDTTPFGTLGAEPSGEPKSGHPISDGALNGDHPPKLVMDANHNVVTAFIDTEPVEISGAQVTGVVKIKRHLRTGGTWETLGAIPCKSDEAVEAFDLESDGVTVVLAVACLTRVHTYYLVEADPNDPASVPHFEALDHGTGIWADPAAPNEKGALDPTNSGSAAGSHCGGSDVRLTFATAGTFFVCYRERGGTILSVGGRDIGGLPTCYASSSTGTGFDRIGERGLSWAKLENRKDFAPGAWSIAAGTSILRVAISHPTDGTLLFTYSLATQQWTVDETHLLINIPLTTPGTPWSSATLAKDKYGQGTLTNIYLVAHFDTTNEVVGMYDVGDLGGTDVLSGTPGGVLLPPPALGIKVNTSSNAGYPPLEVSVDRFGHLAVVGPDADNNDVLTLFRYGKDERGYEWERLAGLGTGSTLMFATTWSNLGVGPLYYGAALDLPVNSALSKHLFIKSIKYGDLPGPCNCLPGWDCAATQIGFTREIDTAGTGYPMWTATVPLTRAGMNLIYLRASTDTTNNAISTPATVPLWTWPNGASSNHESVAAGSPIHVFVRPGPMGSGSVVRAPLLDEPPHVGISTDKVVYPFPTFYVSPRDDFGNFFPTAVDPTKVSTVSIYYDTENQKGPEDENLDPMAAGDHIDIFLVATNAGLVGVTFNSYRQALYQPVMAVDNVQLTSSQQYIFVVAGEISDTSTAHYVPDVVAGETYNMTIIARDQWTNLITRIDPRPKLMLRILELDDLTSPTCTTVDCTELTSGNNAVFTLPTAGGDTLPNDSAMVYVSFVAPTVVLKGYALQVALTGLEYNDQAGLDGLTNDAKVDYVLACSPADAPPGVNGTWNGCDTARQGPLFDHGTDPTDAMYQVTVWPNVPVEGRTLLDFETSQRAGEVKFKFTPRDRFDNFSPTNAWKVVLTPTTAANTPTTTPDHVPGISGDAHPAPVDGSGNPMSDVRVAVAQLTPWIEPADPADLVTTPGGPVDNTELVEFTDSNVLSNFVSRVGEYRVQVFMPQDPGVAGFGLPPAVAPSTQVLGATVIMNGQVTKGRFTDVEDADGDGLADLDTTDPLPVRVLTVVANEPSANSRFSALPQQVIRGRALVIYLEAYDVYGNRSREDSRNGGNVDVTLVHLNVPSVIVEADVADAGRGNYVVSFVLQKEGKYRLSIQYDGVVAPASFSEVEALSSLTQAGQMTVDSSLAVVGGKFVGYVAEPFRFGLAAEASQTADQVVNTNVAGKVRFNTPQGVEEIALVFLGGAADRRWTTDFVPMSAETYAVEVTANNVAVYGSPFVVQVQAQRYTRIFEYERQRDLGLVVPATWTPTVQVEALTSVVTDRASATKEMIAGDELVIFLDIRDEYGNQMTVIPDAEVTVRLENVADGSLLPLQLALAPAGSPGGGWGGDSTTTAVLKASVTVTIPGSYRLVAYYHEVRICNPGKVVSSTSAAELPCLPTIVVHPGLPVVFTPPPAVPPVTPPSPPSPYPSTTMFGPGLVRGPSTRAVTQNKILYQPRDSYGNVCRVSDVTAHLALVQIYFEGPYLDPADAEAATNTNALTPTVDPDARWIEAEYSLCRTPGDTVRCLPGTYSARLVVDGVLYDQQEFLITPGPPVFIGVDADYVFSRPGNPIRPGDRTIPRAAAWTTQCTPSALAGPNPTYQAGQTEKWDIMLRDAHGAPIEPTPDLLTELDVTLVGPDLTTQSFQEGHFEVEILGARGYPANTNPVEAYYENADGSGSVVHQMDKTLRVATRFTKAGDHRWDLFVSGYPAMDDCTLIFTVTHGPPATAGVSVYGDGVSHAEAGVAAEVFLKFEDAFGNHVTTEADVRAATPMIRIVRKSYLLHRYAPVDNGVVEVAETDMTWHAWSTPALSPVGHTPLVPDPNAPTNYDSGYLVAEYTLYEALDVMMTVYLYAGTTDEVEVFVPMYPKVRPGPLVPAHTLVYGGGAAALAQDNAGRLFIEAYDAHFNRIVLEDAMTPYWVQITPADANTVTEVESLGEAYTFPVEVYPLKKVLNDDEAPNVYVATYVISKQGTYDIDVYHGDTIVRSFTGVTVTDPCVGGTGPPCPVITDVVPDAANSYVTPWLAPVVAGDRGKLIIQVYTYIHTHI